MTIYLTMIPELAYIMLACTRIGAIHSIIFGGFSPDSIAGRINDCQSDYLITADEGVRGGKTTPLKSITDVLKVTFPVLFLVYLMNIIINFFAEGEPANYWFMMQRPAGQSIVDLMPDPPFHYIFFIILGVLMFYIIYFPFYLRDKLK